MHALRSLVPLLLLAPAASAQVLTVDDDAPAGFPDIQGAIDAAGEGDLILVRTGDYPGFTLDGKALRIVADTGAAVEVEPSRVRNLAAAQPVLIRGLSWTRESTAPVTATLLVVEDCLGPVWLEECTIDGAAADPVLVAGALRVEDCAGAVLVRCTVRGALGSPFLVGPGPFDGNDGLIARNAAVSVFESFLQGGDGATGWWTGFDTFVPSQAGGAGVRLDGGSLFAAGSTLRGGDGGDGADWQGASCFSGRPGGSGLLIDGGGHADLLDLSVAGGAGGLASAPLCVDGSPGAPTQILAGTSTALPGVAQALVAASPVCEGGLAAVTVQGTPGALAVLATSFSQGYTPSPAWLGTLLLGPVPSVLVTVTIPTGGAAPLAFAIPAFLPPGTGLQILLQAGLVLPGGGGVVLSSGSAVTLLDASL